MNEADFWKRLEFRLCREILGLKEKNFHRYWCDGFIPDAFDTEGDRPTIKGWVWMGIIESSRQETWRFSLFIEEKQSRDGIDWAELLPNDDVTGWLSIDVQHKLIEIDPRSAYPDLASK
jgi:hypothetical protein